MKVILHRPQIIFITMILLNIGMDIVNHGKERKGKHNIFITLIGAVITITILAVGGFFVIK